MWLGAPLVWSVANADGVRMWGGVGWRKHLWCCRWQRRMRSAWGREACSTPGMTPTSAAGRSVSGEGASGGVGGVVCMSCVGVCGVAVLESGEWCTGGGLGVGCLQGQRNGARGRGRPCTAFWGGKGRRRVCSPDGREGGGEGGDIRGDGGLTKSFLVRRLVFPASAAGSLAIVSRASPAEGTPQ